MQRHNSDLSTPPCSAELLTELNNMDCMIFYTIKMAFQTENTALIVMLFELPGALESLSVCALKNFLISVVSVTALSYF